MKAGLLDGGFRCETIEGAGPVLVFLHEALGGIGQWKDFPAALCARTGRPGLVYERLGHGGSAPFAAPRGPDFLDVEAAEVLPRVLEAAGIRGPVVPVGHSDGGTIALLYAAAFPARAAGVVSEAAHVFNDEHTRRGVRSTLEGAARLKERLARHHGEKTDELFDAWHEIWLSPGFRDWDIRPLLPAITAPVLAIQGEDDKYCAREQLDAIAGSVRAGRSLLLPGCGHAPHHERRDAALDAMSAFIVSL